MTRDSSHRCLCSVEGGPPAPQALTGRRMSGATGVEPGQFNSHPIKSAAAHASLLNGSAARLIFSPAGQPRTLISPCGLAVLTAAVKPRMALGDGVLLPTRREVFPAFGRRRSFFNVVGPLARLNFGLTQRLQPASDPLSEGSESLHANKHGAANVSEAGKPFTFGGNQDVIRC